MSDLFDTLVAQARGDPSPIQPRLRSRFDPRAASPISLEVEEIRESPDTPTAADAVRRAMGPATAPFGHRGPEAVAPPSTPVVPPTATPPVVWPATTIHTVVAREAAPLSAPRAERVDADVTHPVRAVAPVATTIREVLKAKDPEAPPAVLQQPPLGDRAPSPPAPMIVTPEVTIAETRPQTAPAPTSDWPAPWPQSDDVLAPDERLSPEHPHERTPVPTIEVTIGRVEVRAIVPPPAPASPPAPWPRLSLDEYLRKTRGDRP